MIYCQMVTLLSLVFILGLVFFRGRFWLADQKMSQFYEFRPTKWPEVAIIVPARNEEDTIALSLNSLLSQQYPGHYSIIVVNDNSVDNTPNIIKGFEEENIFLIDATPKPALWNGKLWALNQGIDSHRRTNSNNKYYMFTDADIVHPPLNLKSMVCKAETEQLSLVSQMALLNCHHLWEKLMIPAFVFFFQMVYPFRLVNNPNSNVAGAAGGCILINRESLESTGGINSISEKIIDDCALGKLIKEIGPIWLGLSDTVKSTRRYTKFSEIHNMIVRTAFEQLHNSNLILLTTLIAMAVVFLLPPIALLFGLFTNQDFIWILGMVSWIVVSSIYRPTLKLYDRPIWEAPLLPFIALLYGFITFDSARHHWLNSKVSWRGRKI